MDWGCSTLMPLAGIGVFAIFLFSPRSGATPEGQLIHVEGTPTKVEVKPHKSPRGGEWYCLECTVSGQTFQWLSSDPRYDQVLAAVQSKQPLTAWVSPKQASVSGTVPLYKLSTNDRVILDYATGAERHDKGKGPALIGGAIGLALGFLGLTFCVYRSRRYRAANYAE